MRTRVGASITLRKVEEALIRSTDEGGVHYFDESFNADLHWDDKETFLLFLKRLTSFAEEEGLLELKEEWPG